MTTADAKAYLAKREIPQLFESLMTGLMYYRPEDHLTYLQDCLRKVQDQGVDSVRWNLFIEQRRKTPLPPINGSIPASPIYSREPSFMTETKSDQKQQNSIDKSIPIAPIEGKDARQKGRRTPEKTQRPGSRTRELSFDKALPCSERRLPGMPNCPIVIVMGGPGSGRATQCSRLIQRYQGWVHLSIGDLLREKIFSTGSADAKWDAVGTLIKHGEMAPEDVTMDLLKGALQKHMSANGIILEGFPRNMEQVQQLDQVIGSVDLVFVLDCEESYLQQRLLIRGQKTERVDDNMKAIANRIAFFKDHTLPVIKHFDDIGKVVIIDGDRDVDEIFYDLSLLFDHTFYSGYGGQAAPNAVPAADKTSPRPPSTPKPRSPRPGSTRYSRPGSRTGRPSSGFVNVPRAIELTNTDNDRNGGLPQCPLLFVLGGPGVNRLAIANKLSQKKGATVLSVGKLLAAVGKNNTEMASDEQAIDVLTDAIKSNADAKAIIVEGFPRNQEQVDKFNKMIGGVKAVVLLDCEREIMKENLKKRGLDEDEIEKRISYYKYHTLPVIAHYDDLRKLVVVNGEQGEDTILSEVIAGLKVVAHEESEDVDPEEPTTNLDAPKTPVTKPKTEVLKLEVDVLDTGRKSDAPAGRMIALLGAPGIGVDDLASKLLGEFAGFELAKTVSEAKSKTDAKGLVFVNYPAKKEEIEGFNTELGGMDLVVVLDCDEEYAKSHAGSQVDELEAYKTQTLPAIAHYEDQNKLEYLNVQRNVDDVFKDLCSAVKRVVSGGENSSKEQPAVIKLSIDHEDLGRQEGLSSTPIIAVMGNTGEHCSKLIEKMPEITHLKNPSVDDIVAALAGDIKGVLLEQFPANKDQFEDFNQKVGGMTGVIMMDATAEYLTSKGATEEQLNKMKQETFPIIAHLEDLGKLEYINSEQDDDTTFEALSRSIELLIQSTIQ